MYTLPNVDRVYLVLMVLGASNSACTVQCSRSRLWCSLGLIIGVACTAQNIHYSEVNIPINLAIFAFFFDKCVETI